MKKAVPLSLCLYFAFTAMAQSNAWQWAQTATLYDSNAFAGVSSIALDASGNVIATGSYQADSVSFGPYTLYSPKDSSEIFVVKYGPAGNVLWARSITGNDYQWSSSVSTDKNGSIYVVGGFFSATLAFGNDTLFQTPGCTGCHPPGDDGFIAKYSPDGAVIWARDFGGDSWDDLSSVTFDRANNLYIGGWFRSDSIVFGGVTLYDSTGQGLDNCVLLKCDTSGQVQWARTIAFAFDQAIATDTAGNIALTGGFWGSDSISVGGIEVKEADAILSIYSQDFFIAKYDPSGHALWARNSDVIGTNSGIVSVRGDSAGNTYVTGYFVHDSVVVDGQLLQGDDTGGYHFIIIKYDTGGHVLWAHGAAGLALGEAVACDSGSNIWVTGSFTTPSLGFGGNTLYNPDSTSSSYAHIFLVEYDGAGNVINTQALGGNSGDLPNDLVTSPDGNLYVCGVIYSDSVDFGQQTFYNLRGNKGAPFVAKYGNTNSAAIFPVSAATAMVNVFPNPSGTGSWTLQVSSDLLGSAMQLSTIGGQLIYKTEITNVNMPVSTAGAGSIYILTITQGNNRVIRKLVKL